MKNIIFLSILSALIFTWFYYASFQPEGLTAFNENIDQIRGENAVFDKKYDLAQDYYANDLVMHPDNVGSQLQYAHVLMLGKFKNINKAISSYQQFLLTKNINDILSLDIIKSMKNIGMQEELLQILSRLEDGLHKVSILKGVDDQAAHQILKLIPKDKRQKEYFKLASMVCFNLNKYKESIKHSEYLIHNGVLDPQVYYIRAQALIRQRQLNKAEESLKIFEMLNSFLTEKDETKKLDIISRLISISPAFLNNQDFRSLYVELLLQLNNVATALEQFETLNISELSSKNRTLLLAIAIKTQAQEIISDLLLYSSNIKINNKNTLSGELILQCHYFYKTDKFKQAHKVCQEGIKIYPKVAPLYFWLGMILLQENKQIEAIQNLKKSINYAPWVDAWRVQLAQVYLSEGNVLKATQLIQESMNKNNPIIQNFILNNGLIINVKD